MRVLFLAPVYPWPLDSGWKQRFHHVLDALARRHEVALVAVDDAAKVASRSPLEARCARATLIDTRGLAPSAEDGTRRERPLRDRVRRALSLAFNDLSAGWCRDVVRVLRAARRERFDAVWASQLEMAELAEEARLARIVVDVDDVPSAIAERELAVAPGGPPAALDRLRLARLHVLERLLPRRFWRLVVSRPEDLAAFRAARRRAFLVPNGIESAPLLQGNERAGELLFVGNLFHGPNVDAIRFFARDVLPRIRRARPDATFVVVGRGANPEVLALDGRDGCRVHVSVPSVDPFYERAALAVAPIRLGAGTKLKVLEALARGKPLVSSAAGVLGLDVRPGVDLLVAEGAAPFAEACVSLLGDAGLGRALGRSGRERVLARYDWAAIHPAIHRALEA